jgi:hypothetical protein
MNGRHISLPDFIDIEDELLPPHHVRLSQWLVADFFEIDDVVITVVLQADIT